MAGIADDRLVEGTYRDGADREFSRGDYFRLRFSGVGRDRGVRVRRDRSCPSALTSRPSGPRRDTSTLATSYNLRCIAGEGARAKPLAFLGRVAEYYRAALSGPCGRAFVQSGERRSYHDISAL